jgi:hypothetical protein
MVPYDSIQSYFHPNNIFLNTNKFYKKHIKDFISKKLLMRKKFKW